MGVTDGGRLEMSPKLEALGAEDLALVLLGHGISNIVV